MKSSINDNNHVLDLDGEIWIDAIGYDGIYQVSNLGRVKSASRWVETRQAVGYFSKEKIRKQQIYDKSSNVRCGLSLNGLTKMCFVSRLIYFSFNYNIQNLPEYFVMHKDNDYTNNNLDNLKIGTREEIGLLTFEKGKLENLKLGNTNLSKYKTETCTFKNGVVTHQLCKECNINKPIKFFYKQSNYCKKCYHNKKHFNKTGMKRQRGFELRMTDVESGTTTLYNNYNDKDLLNIISVGTAIKYANSGEICYPKPQSKKKFKPFKLEILK